MTTKTLTILLSIVLLLAAVGFVWFLDRYDERPRQSVALTSFTERDYQKDPEIKSHEFGRYPHRQLVIERTDDSKFRFILEPTTRQSATIELLNVDLAHFVAAVSSWVKTDPDLTTIGLIDREWNRQQIRFSRHSPHVRVHEGGDGFEQRALSRVDLARTCIL